jgi:O-antigen/teichoic acid export membrane protein
LPITVGTALLAHQFIDAIYGSQFEPSIGVLQIMVFMLPAVSFSVLANQVLIANNRQLAWTKVTIAAAIINPLLNLILIPLFQSRTGNGAIGAAISLLATEVGMALAGLYLLPPILDASSLSRLLRAVAATGGMALAVWMSTGMGVLIAVAIGGIVFATLAIAFKLFTAEERAILRRITLRLFWNDSGRYSTTKYRGWDDISARPIGKFGR